MGHFNVKHNLCCIPADTDAQTAFVLASVTALFSPQALSMGMMTEYYHYIFTTLVSVRTRFFYDNEMEMDHLMVLGVGWFSFALTFWSVAAQKKRLYDSNSMFFPRYKI